MLLPHFGADWSARSGCLGLSHTTKVLTRFGYSANELMHLRKRKAIPE